MKTISYIIIIFLLLTICKSFVSAQQTNLILHPSQDVTITSNAVGLSDNYSETFLCGFTKTFSPKGTFVVEKRSLIKFDLISIPSDAIILNATLTLYGTGHTNTIGSYLQPIINNWSESTLTWSNQPQVVDEQSAFLDPTTDPYANYEIDMSFFVDRWVKGAHNYGLLFRQGEGFISGSSYFKFASSDYLDSTMIPKLEINYILPLKMNYTLIEGTVQWTNNITTNISGGVPPYSLAWNTGATTANLTGAQDGIYTLSVIDAIGIEATFQVIAQEHFPVTWSNLNNTIVDGNKLISVESSDPLNTTYGAASLNKIEANTDGGIRYTIDSTSGNRTFGLRETNIDTTSTTIEFKISLNYLLTDILWAFSPPQRPTATFTVSAQVGFPFISIPINIGDVHEITRTGNNIKWIVNNRIVQNFPIGSNKQLIADASFNSPNALLAGVEMSVPTPGSTCTIAVPLPPATYTCSGTQLQITDSVYWMKFNADTTSMRIAIQNPTDTTAANIQKLILYSGDCNTLQEIARKDKGLGELLDITKTDFVVGNTYFAKAMQTDTTQGSFGVCSRLVPIGGICANAITVAAITENKLIERFSMNNQTQWLQFIPNTSDIMISILFSDISIGAQINSLTLYSGTCDNMQMIDSKSLAQNEILNINATNLNPTQTYYIKVTSNNNSNDFYRIAFTKKSISTLLNKQSKLLFFPNSQYVDFNDPTILKNLPENLNENSDGYQGETTSQCQSIVHDKDGNLLFFIVDNNIYNKNGVPFYNTFFDEPGYPSGSYAFLHDGNPKKCDGSDLLYYNYSEGLAITNDAQGELGSEILVVPVPKSCNEFFLIYSLHLNDNCGISPSVFYRKIRIDSEDRAFMTEPIRIDPSSGIFDPSQLCSDKYQIHMAITDYRADQEDYILFVNYYSYVFIYQVTSEGIECSTETLKYEYLGWDDALGEYFSEMEVVKTPNNMYLLALPFHANPDYWFITYPYEFSSIITNNSDNWTWFQLPPNTDPQYKSMPKGLEFSPSGNRIFFTYSNQQDILCANIALNSVTFAAELVINNMGIGNTLASKYENTQIELGRDGNLYLIGSDGSSSSISRIVDPDGLSPTLEENCYVGNIPQLSYYNSLINVGIYILPDQIDGSDYETNWPLVFYSTPTTFANTEIWTPQSNPFKNGESSFRINQDLEIPAGKKVTIKDMTLMFTDNSGIKLNSGNLLHTGAQLFLDNTKISNDIFCNSSSGFWKGITVKGNYSSQIPIFNTQNAYLRVFNNSVIENAESGVTVYNSGIIKSSDAVFKNNKSGVTFKQSSGYTGTFVQSQSSFSNNQFITDNLTLDLDWGNNNDPNAFVKMFNVSGINFYNNVFKNTMSKLTSAEYRGYGIYADNSTFSILPVCTCSVLPNYPCPVTCFQKNSFEGLFNAIKSVATSSSSATVEHAVFKNNLTAMLFEGTSNNPKIRFNDIDINYTFSTSFIAQPAGYGIYINACYNYVTDENTIYRSENDNGIMGLIIYNTQGSGEIYNNTFKNIPAVAFSAIGQNPGVKIVCNKFGKDDGTLGNDYDISVPKYSPYLFGTPVYNRTINTQQFSVDATQQQLSARNLFYTNRFTADQKAFFTNAVTNTMPQDYYTYKCNTPTNGQTNWTDFVDCYSDYYIFKTSVTLQFTPSQCPSRLTNGNSNTIDLSTARLSQFTNEILSSKNDLTLLVDKGNTSLLLTLIRNSTNGTYKTLCDKLLAASPYLSDTVLLAFMRDQKMYNPVRKSGVILANSPLPIRAKNEIDNMNMPQHFKQEIWQSQTGTNQRVLKEEYLSNLVFEREKLLDNTVCMTLNDTLQNKTDSLIILLQNENTFSAKQMLVPILINKERYSDATYELGILPSLINSLPAQKQQEIYDYIDIQNFIISLNQQPANLRSDFIQNNSAFLRTIANTVSPTSVDAQLLLEKAEIENYPEIIALPVITNNQRIINPDNSNNVNENFVIEENPETFFTVFPNPANDILYVEYVLLDKSNDNKIEIFSIDGRVLKSVLLSNKNGCIEINISNIASGSYYLSICNKGKKEYTKLINIIR